MSRRTFLAAVAVFPVIVFVAVFAVLPVFAQTNSAPQFSAETATRNVDENSPSFHNIGDPVTATGFDDDRLVYTLENARTSPFTIVRATGQLQVGAPLDYETAGPYTVKVIATNTSDAKDTITVTINVNNVDEPGKVSLTWTRPQVGVYVEASLTDPDGSVSSETWQWENSTNQTDWTDATGTGATSGTYTPQPGDARKHLRAVASYTDPLGSGKTARSAAAYVKEAPDPNRPPVFEVHSGGGYDCTQGETEDVCLHVRRSVPAGSDIYYPASATDPDGDELRYSLGGSDHELFRIGPLSGDLYTTKAHAYNDPGTDGIFKITIIATDPSDPSDNSGIITVALKPSGSAGSPVVKGPERIVYPENGTWPLATYSATTSPDREIRGWIISVEPGGGDGDFFDIDDDGVLTFTQPPDYENPADESGDYTYSFTIMAYDPNPPSGQRPGRTLFMVRVTVADVDEPLEVRGPTAVDYAENGTDAVATYTLHGTSAPVEWSLSGADGGEFSIDANGVLTFNGQPDYENPTDAANENAYLVTITAYVGEQSKTEFVRVRVTDVNEPPKFDEGAAAPRSVDRSASVDQVFGELVKATDPDEDGLTYTLENLQLFPFDIAQYTGQLFVSEALDDAQSSYTVSVSVRDSKDADGNPDTIADDRIPVTITVTNVNEAPAFAAETDARTIAENTEAGQPIGDPVEAGDPDAGDSLTYTLGGADVASFSIVTTSGQLQTKAALDHETKPSYEVTVSVRDSKDASGNPDTATDATITITITVTDENDPPAFAAETDARTIAENTEAGQPIGDPVEAGDPDAGDSLTYTLGGDDAASFDIVTTSGQLQTKAALDLETKPSYEVTVSVRDSKDASGNPDTATDATITITITVTDENDPPAFAAETDARTIAENTEAGQPIGDPVEAGDPDAGDSLTYTLGGDDAASFDIVTTSGQLQTKAALDLETKPSYEVTVSVRDSKDASGNPDTATDATITITITVTDENDPPAFAAETDARTIAENTEAGQPIGDPVEAGDPDAGDSLTYTLGGDDAASFDIVTTSGQLQTKAALDLETKPSYEVTVSVRDSKDASGNPDTATDATITITITVTDENDPPAFAAETDARTIAENTEAGQPIGDPVEAGDPDAGDSLTYTLGGADVASFSIVTTSGQLQTKAALDLETKASYEVTVSVRDSKDASGNPDTATDATITITITVTDENDPPAFAAETDARTIAENTEAGQPIGDPVEAGDPDAGDSLTYTLGGADVASFSIVTTSGQLQTKAALDLETKASYEVTVSVRDSKDASGNPDTATDATITITITVTDENDPPAFAAETDARTIAENTEAGQPIGDPVEAGDPDAGDSLTYTLGGADVASFSIVTTSGQLQTKAALDLETKASYEVTVSVRDSKDASGNPDTATDDTIAVTITVTGENDPPKVTGHSSVDYAENGAEDVATYTADDPEGASITWSLSGDDAEDFVINGGVLTFGATPNFEDAADANTDNVYLVTVEASDGSVKGTLDVTVTVTGVSEAPEFPATETRTRAIAENTEAGQPIGDPVEAGDPDAGDSLTYTLGGADVASFSIVTTSGQLQTKAALDHETKPSYEVTVSVRDSKDASGNPDTATDATITITITVTDENDPPAFAAETDARTIAENTPASRNIGTPVSATDPDAGETLTYTLGGADAASFDIVTTSGQLQTKAALDHETKPSYSVRVTASDPSNVSDTIPVTIIVTDENDPPEFPATETGTRAIAENTEAGQPIGDPVEAGDPDVGDSLTYTLSGADAASFGIVDTSGQLQTKAALDHETKPSYTVTVTATDQSNASDTIPVTITVTNVNEGPEVSGAPTRDYAENGTDPVATYTVTNPENGEIAWSLLGDDSADFSINSGVLAFNTPPDHEAPADADTNNVYLVTIKASDGNNADTLVLTVTVTDENEPPVVTGNSVIDYPENGADPVATYTAADPENAQITWSLSGDDSGDFSISNAGVLTFDSPPDYEAPASDVTDNVYLVEVRASDGPNTGTLPVAVTVTNANEQPAFAVETDARIIAESPVAGRNVGTPVSATDSDAGDTLTYELGGADAASFDIIPRSGQLKTKADLDFEDKASYTVTVSVRDSKDPSGNTDTTTDGTISVTIFVTDVDEPPEVTGLPSVNYAENGAEDVATYTADDPEGDTTVDWTLGGADYDDFSISNEGVLTFKTSPNYEAPADADGNNVYQVTIKASDGAKTGNLEVTVTVTDENELPAFASGADSRTIAENTAAGQNIGTPVSATDPDAGDTLTYTLGGDDAASFDIVVTSGQLQTKAALDHEGRASYEVTVSVRDSKNASGNTDTATEATITVTITVTNVNEPPEFPSAETGARQVDENTAAGQNIGAPFSATDPDAGETLTYSLGGTDAASFDIVATSGQLRTKAALNYEIKSTYTVTVTATDREDVSDTIEVTITVTNVNEPPVVTGKSDISYAENGDGTVAAYTAVDPENVPIAWSLSGDDSGDFSISSAGVLTFDTSPDYEAAEDTDPDNVYLVTVQASDGVNTVSLEVTVTVTDENEMPVVTGNSLIDYPENGADSVATYTAADPENAQITWSLSGDDSGNFSISNAGVLTFDSPPDYEAPASDVTDNVYLVEVRASDGTNTGMLPVAVTVTNVNEPPAFAAVTATRTIAENPAAGVDIGMPVSATDPEVDTLIYSLDGTDAASFDIITTSGQLQTKALLNSETRDTYTVTVSVHDGKNASGDTDTTTDDTITVTINVTDENEPPVVTGNSLIDYPENGADPVATYTADDPENAQIIWLLSGDDSGDFSISSAGVLTFDSPPDYEVPPSDVTDNIYLVTIEASDGNNTGTLDVTVTVTDENEPPAFAEETAAHSIAENTAAGRNIGTPVSATDPDAGDTTLTYTLGGDDAASFSIVATSGQLQTKAALDHETKPSYEVTVSVRDSKDASGNTDTATDATITITITVTNVNEPPEFPSTETGARSVAENTPASRDIGTPVSATDPDAGETLTYTLGGADAASFSIVTTSGQLQTKAALDHETKASYEVTVSVRDSRDASGNADTTTDETITVTITVTNIDETGTVTLSSAQPQVYAAFTATLTDPDGSISGVTWQWESSPDGSTNWTAIGGATAATYTPAAGYAGNYLRATASYTDGEGPGKSAQEASAHAVRRAPASNRAPVFPSSETGVRQVRENTVAGTNIGGRVGAVDRNTLTYTLGGPDASSFGIIATSGQLQTKAPLDYESKSSYTVTVTATDPSNAKDVITITITVTNVDETPVVTVGPSIKYAENGIGTVATYTATDPEGTAIAWSLSGVDSGPFSISSAGALTFNTPPDYEDPADADMDNVYLLTVEASDGTVTGALEVTVTVTDEIETSELPSTETGGWIVEENTVAETNIGSPVVVMDDADATLTYTLGGPDAASFGIIASSGQLQTKAPLDYETKASHSVEVTATPLSGVSETIPVTIMVEDVSLGEVGDTYDTDHNEKINKQEAIEAVRDYFRDLLSKEDTIGVIRLYFAS